MGKFLKSLYKTHFWSRFQASIIGFTGFAFSIFQVVPLASSVTTPEILFLFCVQAASYLPVYLLEQSFHVGQDRTPGSMIEFNIQHISFETFKVQKHIDIGLLKGRLVHTLTFPVPLIFLNKSDHISISNHDPFRASRHTNIC